MTIHKIEYKIQDILKYLGYLLSFIHITVIIYIGV